MNSLLIQLGVSFRLHFRNKMALLYSYLFPTIFLLAFWVLYRHEPVPLVRHMGELLTVTALGGACFGLPTAMVSERERGVWRRYRLAPIPIASVVTSTVIARYFLLTTAGLLQLGLAIGIGMPMPEQPFGLWLAFTFVAFAFLGLGLVIAMLADNVPAVQALGQSVFLPMLIVGGVAVPLERLPAWAQHVSAFFPGRYAVEALQVCVTGAGLAAARFSLVALILIGGAGCLAGAKMFRWDVQQRFSAHGGKGWVAVSLAAWLAVGLMAEFGRYIAIVRPPAPAEDQVTPTALAPTSPTATGSDAPTPPPRITEPAVDSSDSDSSAAVPSPRPPSPATEGDTVSPSTPGRADDDSRAPAAKASPEASPPAAPAGPDSSSAGRAPSEPESWQAASVADIDDDLYESLPPDEGVVAPIATAGDALYPELETLLDCVRNSLPSWVPGLVNDPVQRVRNYLYIAAVPDMFRMEELERWVPLAVFDHLRNTVPDDQLAKILYWIALHPSDGDDSAADQLGTVCIDTAGPSDVATLRERAALYALKLLGRLTGAVPSS